MRIVVVADVCFMDASGVEWTPDALEHLNCVNHTVKVCDIAVTAGKFEELVSLADMVSVECLKKGAKTTAECEKVFAAVVAAEKATGGLTWYV